MEMVGGMFAGGGGGGLTTLIVIAAEVAALPELSVARAVIPFCPSEFADQENE